MHLFVGMKSTVDWRDGGAEVTPVPSEILLRFLPQLQEQRLDLELLYWKNRVQSIPGNKTCLKGLKALNDWDLSRCWVRSFSTRQLGFKTAYLLVDVTVVAQSIFLLIILSFPSSYHYFQWPQPEPLNISWQLYFTFFLWKCKECSFVTCWFGMVSAFKVHPCCRWAMLFTLCSFFWFSGKLINMIQKRENTNAEALTLSPHTLLFSIIAPNYLIGSLWLCIDTEKNTVYCEKPYNHNAVSNSIPIKSACC